jgi:hypothetical protein
MEQELLKREANKERENEQMERWRKEKMDKLNERLAMR